MSTVYVTEYAEIARVASGAATHIAQGPAIRTQTISTSAASTTCALAFSQRTKLVRVHTDGIVSVALGGSGKTPTAQTTDARMAANQTEYFGTSPGGNIAVIDNT